MAVNCFLKIEGPPIEGDSAQEGHDGEMDILSWSLGVSQSGTMQIATGGAAGKANFQDMHVTKRVDKASPNLMQSCAAGRQFEKATLTCMKQSGTDSDPIPYVVFEMSDVIMSSYTLGGSDGQDLFMENLSLNFASVNQKFVPQKDDGTPDTEVAAGWNIRTNKTL